MNKKDLVIGAIGILLLGTSIAGLTGWHSSKQRVSELEAQLKVMERQEKRTAVLRSVSQQMEELAVQQKTISDVQREEALQQTRVANEMRQRSEIEQANAIAAERSAVASEKKALEASAQAEYQRQIAEHQRIQAEMSKRVADTLSYITLGRSLGSLSAIQNQAGSTDIATLLSYAAYVFTYRYGGDIYYPTIYKSLSTMSGSTKTRSIHQGALTDMAYLPNNDKELITISNYGGIVQTHINGQKMTHTVLFQNSKYDFRALHIDKNSNNIYAASRTGHLFVKTPQQQTIIDLVGMTPLLGLTEMEPGKTVLLIGSSKIALLDIATNTIKQSKSLPFKVTYYSRYDYLPILFDDKGKMHVVKDMDGFKTSSIPTPGTVTAFASSKNTGLSAFGMSDGTIYLKDKQGNIRKLVGHRSRISKMKINGNRLYSSSYDGQVNLWITNSEKAEPMNLFTTNSWIMNFIFTPAKDRIVTGDMNGNLSNPLISVPKMVDLVKLKLKRDMTPEEWNYFVGGKVPYESFLHPQRKEDSQ